MRILKILIISLLLIGGAAAIVTAGWMYSPVLGLFLLGAAMLMGGIVCSEIFRDDGNS